MHVQIGAKQHSASLTLEVKVPKAAEHVARQHHVVNHHDLCDTQMGSA